MKEGGLNPASIVDSLGKQLVINHPVRIVDSQGKRLGLNPVTIIDSLDEQLVINPVI